MNPDLKTVLKNDHGVEILSLSLTLNICSVNATNMYELESHDKTIGRLSRGTREPASNELTLYKTLSNL